MEGEGQRTADTAKVRFFLTRKTSPSDVPPPLPIFLFFISVPPPPPHLTYEIIDAETLGVPIGEGAEARAGYEGDRRGQDQGAARGGTLSGGGSPPLNP